MAVRPRRPPPLLCDGTGAGDSPEKICDERGLPIVERLKLFVQICQAVQHSHQKGVIHRDIKPTNVLVTEHDGQTIPTIIDFGLAKALQGQTMLTENTLFTSFGSMVGTPLYMGPEQVGINALNLEPRWSTTCLRRRRRDTDLAPSHTSSGGTC